MGECGDVEIQGMECRRLFVVGMPKGKGMYSGWGESGKPGDGCCGAAELMEAAPRGIHIPISR